MKLIIMYQKKRIEKKNTMLILIIFNHNDYLQKLNRK